jgi:hypothetical protein
MVREILKFIWIIQEVSNNERHKNGLKRLGKGYSTAIRFNPYNPLSYLAIVLMMVIGILMFGLVGFWKETDCRNPFRWD